PARRSATGFPGPQPESRSDNPPATLIRSYRLPRTHRSAHAGVRSAVDDLGSRLVDAQIHPWVLGQTQFDRGSPPRWAEEQQEPSSAGPEQLAAERAGLQARAIHRVDHVVGDRPIKLALELPGLVQQAAEAREAFAAG